MSERRLGDKSHSAEEMTFVSEKVTAENITGNAFFTTKSVSVVEPDTLLTFLPVSSSRKTSRHIILA